jgi:hypothetical protein
MGDHIPEWPWSDPAEPPPAAGTAYAGGKNTRPAPRGRYPVVWAAAGLVLIGGSAAVVAMHEAGGRPRPQPVFCGLVECNVLRSEAAAASAPTGNPRAQPFPSPVAPSRTVPPPTPMRTPEAAPATPAPSPAPAPAPAVTPPPAPAPEPTHWPGPLPVPLPVPTWTPPAPAWPWPSRWAPPPRWPAAGEGWFHHSPWREGQSNHQPHWW